VLSGGHVTETYMKRITAHHEIASSCLPPGFTCDMLNATQYRSPTASYEAVDRTCTTTSTGCSCDATYTTDPWTNDATYMVSGSVFTDPGSSRDFCVRDNHFNLHSVVAATGHDTVLIFDRQ